MQLPLHQRASISLLLLLEVIIAGLVLADDDAVDLDAAMHQDSVPDVSPPRRRITLLGLDEFLQASTSETNNPRLNYEELHANDLVEDSFYDPFSPDPSCFDEEGGGGDANDPEECWHPPSSTVEEELVEVSAEKGEKSGLETLAWGYGGDDPDDAGALDGQSDVDSDEECKADKDTDDTEESQCQPKESETNVNGSAKHNHTVLIDKHWGSDRDILRMRDRLRGTRSRYWDWIEQQEKELIVNATNKHEKGYTNTTKSDKSRNKATSKPDNKQSQRRPPVFLLPGLASTRLVSWKHKPCPQSALLSDIKMLDYVWLNMNLLIQMATIDVRCWSECMTLGKFQQDYDEEEDHLNDTDANDSSRFHGCKLRPDEGLDAISSLAPGSISSSFFVGGTNTVYAWLIQWLADNLGYDVSSIVALPYDWR